MISIKTKISSYAFNAAKHKSFKDEHWLAIVFAWFVRLTTAGVSIYSGWFFFVNYLKPMSQPDSNAPYVFSVLLLIAVEYLAAYTITKFTKAVLHKKTYTSIIIGLFATGIFALSFHSSTNGLAARQSKKADNSDIIIANANLQRTNIADEYDKQISELKQANKLELKNLQGWNNGKRSLLSEVQMKRMEANNYRIAELNNLKREEISELKHEQKNELKENRFVVMEESNKYWLFIAIVLAVSALSNISLQAFSHVILKQEARDVYLKGHILELKMREQDAITEDKLTTYKNSTNDLVNGIELVSALDNKLNYSLIESDKSTERRIDKDQEEKKSFLDVVKNNMADFTEKHMFRPGQLNFEELEKKKPPLPEIM